VAETRSIVRSVIIDVSMPMDRFAAGPNDTEGVPLGGNGERRHEWMFHPDRQRSGDAGAVEELRAPRVGAVVMGWRTRDVGVGAAGVPSCESAKSLVPAGCMTAHASLARKLRMVTAAKQRTIGGSSPAPIGSGNWYTPASASSAVFSRQEPASGQHPTPGTRRRWYRSPPTAGGPDMAIPTNSPSRWATAARFSL
jgi:hypothetical protein